MFIALGDFYFEMALFHALGQFVAESGGSHILNECPILDKGSTKSFQTGEIYKRYACAMHQILTLAMEKLHFEPFLEIFKNPDRKTLFHFLYKS